MCFKCHLFHRLPPTPPCCYHQARLSRPPRERTLDAVSAALGAQEALLGRLAGQLRGALAGVEAEAGKLQGAAAGLDKDLEDKVCGQGASGDSGGLGYAVGRAGHGI
jgi:hypothetical protein